MTDYHNQSVLPSQFLRDVQQLRSPGSRHTVLAGMAVKYGPGLPMMLASTLTDVLEGAEEATQDREGDAKFSLEAWVNKFPSPQGDDVKALLLMIHGLDVHSIESHKQVMKQCDEFVFGLSIERQIHLLRDLATFLASPAISGSLNYSDEELAEFDKGYEDFLVRTVTSNLDADLEALTSDSGQEA